jgi:kumamolisin
MPERYAVLPDSYRPAKSDARRLRNVDPDAHVEVTLDLRKPELPSADQRGPTLSFEEFQKKYGSSPEDAQKVAEVLKRFGIKVEEVSLGSFSMRVSGTAGAMESAFAPGLGIYHSANGEYRGREGDIKIPIELAGIIKGVHGFDERSVAHRAAAAGGNLATAPQLSPLGPADLEARYQFPPGDGAGQTIAIAEFGGCYFPDDLKQYCAKFNRPVPNVQVQGVGVTPLTPQQVAQLSPSQQQTVLDESGEVMMDVQVIAGLCPKASIVMYFADFTQKGWVDLMNQVISGKPAKVVTLSVSWGNAEDSPDWSKSARSAVNDRMNAASMLGITVCVSSGDDGSGDAVGDKHAHVDFPGSSPFVLSVGGTMLTATSAGPAESTWWVSPGQRNNKGGGSSGGGVSTVFQRPTWQNVHVASVNPGSIDGRVVPDVAALAGPPLYDLIFQGQDSPNGGTSASAPLWASLIARMNAQLPAAKQQRFLTVLLYQTGANGQPRGTACRDITVGQNVSHPLPGVGYQAGAGFDAVTGWGVPDGASLLNVL